MDRWIGKVAVVTGASSGIGAAIAKDLASAGMIVIGLARRVERVEALKKDLPKKASGNLHAMKCDVSDEQNILKTFKTINEKFGGIDVLLNNAGILRQTDLLEAGNSQMLKEVLDTNVMGLVICSREAFQSMKQRSVDGHIIHINSITGHHVVNFPKLSMYPASKFAVTAITETMRNELRTAETKIKVTSISPGAVKTEIIEGLPLDFQMLEPEDISAGVLYVLGTPPRVQVHELMIKPVGEPY
ncbi:farnesol dehydrogenase-like [Uranotaenia lowii]|uniref:farnesol dehydrogenase-like n=1 Tax=Uranotaenia lowii TaxID=190385 RepID=UPI00247A8174|nr:farnesol dehydrogenase-like [Uranotaenia lowii]